MHFPLRAFAVVLCVMAAVPRAAAQSASGEVFDPAAARKQLRSPDIQTRKDTLWTIDQNRKEARGLIDALVAALADPDLVTRYTAAYVLTSVDPERAAPALPILDAMLRSDVEMNSSSPRILGPAGLGRLGRAGANALVAALADSNPATRIAAAHGLMNSDVFPPAAAPALIKAARGPDAVARHQALVVLVIRKPPVEQMLQPLLDALLDPEADMRTAAASGLGRYGRDAIRALEALKLAAKDSDGRVAICAASAVAAIDRQAGLELLPMFIAELTRPERARRTDEHSDMRLMDVAGALAILGPDAGRALPALIRAFEREGGWAKLDLGIAVARVDPRSAGPIVTFLIDALENGDDTTRLRTLHGLAEVGPTAAAAAPAVTRLTSSPEKVIRDAATKALAAIKR
jgi:HEAT repeat protein